MSETIAQSWPLDERDKKLQFNVHSLTGPIGNLNRTTIWLLLMLAIKFVDIKICALGGFGYTSGWFAINKRLKLAEYSSRLTRSMM